MGILLLVRHGQASFGAADYDLLSSTGRQQARRLGAYLAAAGLEPDVVVHGGLRRQAATAEEMAMSAGWDVERETDDRWDEFDHLAVLAAYGVDPAGMDRRAFQAAFEEATTHWQGTDGWTDFQDRTTAALSDAADRAGSGRVVLAVTSGGVIAAIAAGLVGGGPESWQRLNTVVVNSSVTRLVVSAGGPRLLTFNEHEHLGRDLLTYR